VRRHGVSARGRCVSRRLRQRDGRTTRALCRAREGWDGARKSRFSFCDNSITTYVTPSRTEMRCSLPQLVVVAKRVEDANAVPNAIICPNDTATFNTTHEPRDRL